MTQNKPIAQTNSQQSETPSEPHKEQQAEQHADPQRVNAKFVSGSLFKHVMTMALTSGFGLLALFAVDMVDLIFIAMLKDTQILASTAFSASVIGFTIAISIGFAIITGALCARAVGAGDRERLRTLISSSALMSLLLSILVVVIGFPLLPQLVSLLGAQGEAHDHAVLYLRILLPSLPLLSVGMTLSAVLRAYGDGKRAMYTTLAASITNAVFDPIFIFAFDWGLAGAAWASVLARLAILVTAWWPIIKRYDGFGALSWPQLRLDGRYFLARCPNTIMQNIATPFGMAVITALMAQYGAEVMAGNTVVMRIFPIIFAITYGLSGAIASIIGQNYGALRFDRVRAAMRAAYLFLLLYCCFASLVLFFTYPWLIDLFYLQDQGVYIIKIVGWGFSFIGFFNGVLFVTNGMFNAMGYYFYSASLNWIRHVIIMLPLLYLGAWAWGLNGIFAAQMLSAIAVSAAAYVISLRLIEHVEHNERRNQPNQPFRWYLPRGAAAVRRNG